MTLFSIALPVYNGARYLREALDSILAQDLVDFDLVVSDNCSSDETPAILVEYSRRDNRLHVSRTDTVLPQAANVNRAVHLCTGDWIKLFCHDDIMHPRCLRTLHGAISHANSNSLALIANAEAWLFANGHCHSPVVADVDPVSWQGRDFLRALLRGKAPHGLPSLTTATVRKDAWMASGGFDGRFVHFDVFLWTNLLMKWDYLVVPQVLTTNRIHGAQVAVSARKMLRSVSDSRLFYDEFLRQHGPALGLDSLTYHKTRCKAISAAASTVAIEILKKHPGRALGLILTIPAHWLPLLPAFVIRSIINERRRIQPIVHRVPLSLIYPE